MRFRWSWLGVICVGVAGAFAWPWSGRGGPAVPSHVAAAARVDPREPASRHFLPRALHGVFVGMGADDLHRHRPGLQRTRPPADAALEVWAETLADDVRVLYVVALPRRILQKIELLSRLADAAAVPARLSAEQQAFGSPGGAWDCGSRERGQLPTRRFAYQSGGLWAVDSYLIVGQQLSATLYIAEAVEARRSLREAHCIPVSFDRATRFPVAVPTAVDARGAAAREESVEVGGPAPRRDKAVAR